jgi:hypothetical protein
MSHLRAALGWIRGSGHLGRGPRKTTRNCRYQPTIEALEDRQVPTVSYFRGSLLPQIQAQAYILANGFSSTQAITETAILDDILKDITDAEYLEALASAGFNVGPGAAVTGAVDNSALNAGSAISDAIIRSRIQGDIDRGPFRSPSS